MVMEQIQNMRQLDMSTKTPHSLSELGERHRRERGHRKGCDGEEAGFSFRCAEFQMPVGITHECKCLMHSETRASRGQRRA